MTFTVGDPPASGNPFSAELQDAMRALGDQPISQPIPIADGITLTAGINHVYLDISGRVKFFTAGTFEKGEIIR